MCFHLLHVGGPIDLGVQVDDLAGGGMQNVVSTEEVGDDVSIFHIARA